MVIISSTKLMMGLCGIRTGVSGSVPCIENVRSARNHGVSFVVVLPDWVVMVSPLKGVDRRFRATDLFRACSACICSHRFRP
jgi:hypothetical protein